MRTTSMRLMATIVATSLGVAVMAPPVLAEPATISGEQTLPEQSQQPMPPNEPSTASPPAVSQVITPPATPPTPVPVQPLPPAPPAEVTPAPVPPPPPTAQPAAPDLFQENIKAEQRAADRSQAAYNAGAAVTNIFLVPGRVITCTLGGVVGVGILALTFGTQYKAAAAAWEEGCGGKWVVGGDDLKPDSGRTFEWER